MAPRSSALVRGLAVARFLLFYGIVWASVLLLVALLEPVVLMRRLVGSRRGPPGGDARPPRPPGGHLDSRGRLCT